MIAMSMMRCTGGATEMSTVDQTIAALWTKTIAPTTSRRPMYMFCRLTMLHSPNIKTDLEPSLSKNLPYGEKCATGKQHCTETCECNQNFIHDIALLIGTLSTAN
jgi:hypothetical protein